MKNSTLWYLTPFAFALLSVSWVSQANFSAGTYEQSEAGRTIQSTQSSAEKKPANANCNMNDAFDENVISTTRHMRVSHSQCPRT